MKIVGMTDGVHRVMILIPEGGIRSPREIALFFSRSITILGEFFMVGAQAADQEGNEIPNQLVHNDAYAAFLSGNSPRWRTFPVPTVQQLLALSDIPETAPDSDPECRCPSREKCRNW